MVCARGGFESSADTQGNAGTISETAQSLTVAHASVCLAPSHTEERMQDI